MRATGAVGPSASHGFLTECDLSTPTRGGALVLLTFPGDQEAASEDHEAPEVVLIEASDLTDQVAIKWHLGYERTQDQPNLQVPSGRRCLQPKGCRRWLGGNLTGVEEVPPEGGREPAGVPLAQVKEVGITLGKEVGNQELSRLIPDADGGGGRLPAADLRTRPHA